ncbi:GPN-loop GTPase 1 [Buteo buteo]|uniref:GPN-loop GTPase 1 n=1 Tax=Buteo buteo TaxID=30397 RepID=UPI003EBD79A4
MVPPPPRQHAPRPPARDGEVPPVRFRPPPHGGIRPRAPRGDAASCPRAPTGPVRRGEAARARGCVPGRRRWRRQGDGRVPRASWRGAVEAAAPLPCSSRPGRTSRCWEDGGPGVCAGAGQGRLRENHLRVQRLAAHLHGQRCPPYVINLDPAVHDLPFPANIDIRDPVKYKEVMKQYMQLCKLM